MYVGKIGPRPEKKLELFEFEACPFCRKVREALTALDLEATIRPCPKGGQRFRPQVIERGGKAMFPYLVDPNTDTQMYESSDIVAYLYERYGAQAPPRGQRLGPLNILSGTLASAARPAQGGFAQPSKAPAQLLELYSFEASPYCRLVREKLCTMELPYVLYNVGKGSPSRPAFIERSGKMMVPYLVDPNTGAAMFESRDILRYLKDTYRP